MNTVAPRRRPYTRKGEHPDWLTTREVAKEFGMSRTRVQVWCDRGQLPHEKSAKRNGVRIHRIVASAFAKYRALFKKRFGDQHRICRRSDDSAGGSVYALIDPRPEKRGQVRYIGKAQDLAKRRRDYREMVRRGTAHSPPLRRWFAKLNAAGLMPVFKVLESCLFGLGELEQKWIDRAKAKGWPLLNCRDGGIGGSLSEATRKRLSEISRAKWADPEYIARWEAAHVRRWGRPSKRYTNA